MGSTACINTIRVVHEEPKLYPANKLNQHFVKNNSLMWKKKTRSMICCRSNGKLRSSNGRPPVATEKSNTTSKEENLVFLPDGKNQEEMGMMDLMSYNGAQATTSLVDFDEGIGIARYLKGKSFLITGATGFLAKVLIEKILRTTPDVGKIFVLIKAKDKEAAMGRLKSEIIQTELFRCLQEIHGNDYNSFMLKKLIPVVGNVREANLGIEANLASKILEEVDVIVNSAANTAFDERYDVALDINTIGPCRLMSFAKRFKKLKLFLQVSTAYVNGQRQGRILEKPFCMGDTIARETVTSESLTDSIPMLDVEAEIKLAFDSLKNFQDNSLVKEMKDLGLERARIHGWQDTYVFTKAMGEMVIDNMRGDIPVVIIRPSVIESTCKEPFPGWMEGNRMMDPIVLYYGKGQLSGFFVDPNGVLDVVPADMVVNATLAAMAKHGLSKNPAMHIYHIASSITNPLVFQELARLMFEHFNSSPYIDSKGRPIHVPRMKLFQNMNDFSSYISTEAVQKSERVAATASHEKLSQRLKNIFMKSLEQAKYLAIIYEPYTFYGGRFDNTNSQKLMEEMSEEERRSFGFNVGSIDWKDYISNVHIPGLRRHVMKGRGTCTNAQIVGNTI